jgi:hypothetical protein
MRGRPFDQPPQDVTSPLVRRGGVNLQPEVAPHLTERPPRDNASEHPTTSESETKHTTWPRRSYPLSWLHLHLPPRQVSVGVRH